MYEGVGLYGSWGGWRIWQLEWKLVRHLQVCQEVDIFSSNQLLVWKYCQDLCQALVSSGDEPDQ